MNPLLITKRMVAQDAGDQLFRALVSSITPQVSVIRDGSMTVEGPYPKLDGVDLTVGDEVLIARIGAGYLIVGRIDTTQSLTVYASTTYGSMQNQAKATYALARETTPSSVVLTNQILVGQEVVITPTWYMYQSVLEFPAHLYIPPGAELVDAVLRMATSGGSIGGAFVIEARVWDWGSTPSTANFRAGSTLGFSAGPMVATLTVSRASLNHPQDLAAADGSGLSGSLLVGRLVDYVSRTAATKILLTSMSQRYAIQPEMTDAFASANPDPGHFHTIAGVSYEDNARAYAGIWDSVNAPDDAHKPQLILTYR